VFELRANTDECAEYACGNQQQGKPSKKTPGGKEDAFARWVQFRQQTHAISQAWLLVALGLIYC
jgi:hypothetical protein